MKNLQIIFTAPLKVELKEEAVPTPGPRQALVRTTRSLISTGTELTVLRAAYSPGSGWAGFKFPWLAGYCNVGVVAETGPEVSKVKVGDRVASEGPHSSFYVMGEDNLRAIPANVPDDEAIFASIAEIVMHGVRSAKVALGENAVICGLGILGQLAVALARFAGAWPVIGVDVLPFRREKALGLGASAVASPEQAPLVIKEQTSGLMADIVIEVTGNPEVIPQEISWLRRQGRLIVLSSPRGPTTMDFHDLVNARGTTIIGTHNFVRPGVGNEYYRWTRDHDASFFLRLASAGLLSAAGLLTDRFPAQQAPAAYDRLLNHPDQALAVALEWDGE